ncbi:GemA protein [bacterium (Candidatus Blackallbacteria) CG13_big_fil_rev_8_21_14_2_50_49_14]|nr:MAG: GemA protein [bacterium (Candidatus Blackallbacteria) CG18_big_fil_WC_8_21_14_2_50_49_26]PIW46623.1 MAG: GemA protein [bacterium (Candidatus Blackallbacteria) CG13_big_fil_rev_8_21_14_2_50_49_14]
MKPDRRKELGIIHAAKKRLGLDDDCYRDLLEGVTGKRSAADLDDNERQKLIAEMERLQGKKPWHKPRVNLPDDKIRMVKKIYAMLGDRPVTYIEAMLKHMFGDKAPDRLEWATPDQLHKVVAALVYDQKRRNTR